ncbi:MAG: hypothetical protein OH363_05555, partial [Candidatus Parvarchaeota archaeon]|nr:hypothetical protein [Candidatus Jingweiarchaeum tengchongense]
MFIPLNALKIFGIKVSEMNKKLRIGIIGTGGIAGAHVMAYKKFNDVEIVGGADIVRGKAKAFFEKWGLP